MAFQIGSSLLDALVLGILQNEDAYGYIITQRAKDLMDVSDSTLYPVLRRLLKEESLHSYDVPFQGRNRRYYSITPVGRSRLQEYIGEWQKYKTLVEKILSGGLD